jgi:hypothetical protein
MSKILNYLLILVCILLAYGWAKSYLLGPDPQYTTIYRVKKVPVLVEQTKASEKMEEKEECVQMVVKSPTLEELTDLASKYESPKYTIDWGNVKIIGEYKVPKAPYGGEVVAGVQGDGKPFVIVDPKKPPLFELGGMRELGISYGYGSVNPSWRAKLRQDLFRVGPVIGTAEVSVNGWGSQSYWSAMLEANVRF